MPARKKTESATFRQSPEDERAIDVLNLLGARQFRLNGKFTIGLWDTREPAAKRAIEQLYGTRGIKPNVASLKSNKVPEAYRSE